MKRAWKTILKLGLFCFLVGAVGLIYYFSKYQNLQPNMVPYDQQVTLDAKEVRNIEIETILTDVSFTVSNLNQISVRLVGNVRDKKKERLKFEHQVAPDGTLQINVEEPVNAGINFGPGSRLHLQVNIPQKQYEQVKIQTSMADIRASALEASYYTLRSNMGNIEIDGFKGKELNVETDTGDIRAKAVDSKVELKSDTGNIENLVLARLTNAVSVETDTGDITIVLKTKPQATSLNLRSDTGDISSNLSDINYDVKEEHELQGSIGTNGAVVKVRSSTGDITLEQE